MNKSVALIGVAFCTLAVITGCGAKKTLEEPSSESSSVVIDKIMLPPSIQDIERENTTEKIETEAETEIIVEEYYEPQETYVEEYYYEEPIEYYYKENYDNGAYSPYDLMYQGVIYWGGWRFTWYSENVLPGDGLTIPGRWSDGNFVRDESGNLCVASSDLPYGSVVITPWGAGVVYDSGCDSGTIDIYTSW